MKISVVRAWPRRHECVELDVPAGATVADALVLAGWSADAVAIHGVRAVHAQALAEGDRIEVLRPLEIDPKQARRRRAADRPLR